MLSLPKGAGMAMAADQPRKARLAAAVFLLASLAASLAAAAVDLPMCQNKKIYILDLNDYAGDDPPCYVDDVAVVNPGNGIVYTTDAKLRERASHKYGTHSAPWYVYQAIKSSQYVTYDIEEADVVFVNSYCYYIWWLGWVHTKGREHKETPGDYLVAAFTRMVQSKRWQKTGGRDYVFYDSHPGFTAGKAAGPFWGFMCHTFKDSMHIVVERAQRNICPTYWDIEKKLLITPYVPNSVSIDDQYGPWKKPIRPVDARDQLLYSKARCTPYKVDDNNIVINVGKKMRHDLVKAMADAGKDVQVECTDQEYGQKHETFKDMLEGMERSVFCLALPGDAASTRRLSETFMAGCIPVFVGPPYNTMPLAMDVDYPGTSLFYNITNYSPWLSQEFQWVVHPTTRANHPQNAWFWVPDADVRSLMISLPDIKDVVPALRKLPNARIDALHSMMESQRHLFVFHETLTEKWSAVNAIISRMCDMAGGPAKPDGASKADTSKRPHRERRQRSRRQKPDGSQQRSKTKSL